PKFLADGSGLSRETKREPTAFGPGVSNKMSTWAFTPPSLGSTLGTWSPRRRRSHTKSINGRTWGSCSRSSRGSKRTPPWAMVYSRRQLFANAASAALALAENRWSKRCWDRAFALLARHRHVAAHHARELARERKAEPGAPERRVVSESTWVKSWNSSPAAGR